MLGVFDEVHQLVGPTGEVGATLECAGGKFGCEPPSNDFEGMLFEQGVRIEENEDRAAGGLGAQVARAAEAAFGHDNHLIAEFASLLGSLV